MTNGDTTIDIDHENAIRRGIGARGRGVMIGREIVTATDMTANRSEVILQSPEGAIQGRGIMIVRGGDELGWTTLTPQESFHTSMGSNNACWSDLSPRLASYH